MVFKMIDKNDYKKGIIFTRDFRKLRSCEWEIVKILKNRIKVSNVAGDYDYLKVGDIVLKGEEIKHHIELQQNTHKRN